MWGMWLALFVREFVNDECVLSDGLSKTPCVSHARWSVVLSPLFSPSSLSIYPLRLQSVLQMCASRVWLGLAE